MSDDPIYTGWLQTQMSGDIDAAKLHERDARRVLGAMITKYGVNALLDAGEPSGFYKDVKTLDDGTRITVWHNNGMNVARIETPARDVPREEAEERQHEHRDWHEHTSRSGDSLSHSDHVTPPHVSLAHQIEHEEEEKKQESQYYMWVGIRSTSPDVRWYAVNGLLIEPESGYHRVDGAAVGVIDTNTRFGGDTTFIELDQIGNDYSVAYGPTDKLRSMIDEQYTYYSDRAGVRYGDHNIIVQMNASPYTETCISANGIIAQSTQMWRSEEFIHNDWMPYDPLLTNDQNINSGRSYGMRWTQFWLDRYGPYLPTTAWDVVYTIDSDPRVWPGDTRPNMLGLYDFLDKTYADLPKADAKFLPGEYKLCVQIQDNEVSLQSTRAGQVIPTTGGTRSSTSDYDDYMKLIADRTQTTVGPVSIDIEVRLNKGEDMLTFKFSSTIATADSRDSNVIPFGVDYPYDHCAGQGGPNPFGPNWMQAVVAINPIDGYAKMEDGPPVPYLGGGTYAASSDSRAELVICVYGNYGVSQPDDTNWAHNAAYAAWRVLESCTSGNYGEQLFKEISQDKLQEIFAGGDRTKINILNCYTGEFSTAPVISNLSDYPYGMIDIGGGQMVQSPYQQDMYWYYPYKERIKANCQNSMGIVITATDSGYDFETGQVVHFGEPSPPDCCT